MERANSIRNAIESWRGGGVRRLVGDLSHRLLGGAAANPPAADPQGGESFWHEPARAVAAPRRRRELWREQGELWPEAQGLREDEVPAAMVVVDQPLRDPLPGMHRADGFELAAQIVPVRPLSRVAPREPAAARRLDVVAKFLQVNDAVHGVRGGEGLALPRGRFAARYALWRGARVGTPFLMGC